MFSYIQGYLILARIGNSVSSIVVGSDNIISFTQSSVVGDCCRF